MYYPKLHDIELIIKQMNNRYNMNVVIINKGQLEFALEKPKMNLFGNEQYPELHQKAAILMEILTKSHTLSDGNKRTAMMAAEFMIKANGGELVLPLKSIRLSVNTAMDDTDSMSELIQKWFKLHTAMNINQICFMLRESIEEESIIKKLLDDKKLLDAENLLFKWMAFDSYPENKKAWSELSKQWKKNAELIEKKSMKTSDEWNWPQIWDSLINIAHTSGTTYSEKMLMDLKNVEDLRYNDNTMDELDAMELLLKKMEKVYETTDDPSLIHQNGLILVMNEKSEDALNFFQKLYDIEDSKLDPLLHMGMIYEDLGNFDKAIKCWEEILQIDPNDTIGLFHMGHILITLKKYDAALTYLEKIPHENMEDRMLFSKAQCLKKLGRLDESVKILEKLLVDNPDNLGVNGMLVNNYIDQNEIEKALVQVNKLIELNPDDSDGYYNKSVILDKLKANTDEIISLLDKVIEMNPNNDKCWINKGALLSNQGKRDDALVCLKRGVDLNPKNIVGLVNMGITLSYLKRYDESIEYFDKALKIDPRNTSALLGQSASYAKLNRILDCLSTLAKTFKIDPSLKEIVRIDEENDFINVKDSEKFKQLIT